MKKLFVACLAMFLLTLSSCADKPEAVIQAEAIDGYHYSVLANPKTAAHAAIKYKDGVYEASLPYSGQGNYDAHAKITIKNGLIVEVLFWEQQENASIGKGKGYIEKETKDWGETNRIFVTNAVNEATKYPAKLIASQDIDKVDVSTSASYSYRRFVPVVKLALAEAIIKK